MPDSSGRPSKRRRTNPSEISSPVTAASSTSSSSDSSRGRDECDLPHNEQVYGVEDRDESHEAGHHQHGFRSKHAFDLSASYQHHENIFVTQLTQPPSSPSRIRGPRWKKRSITPVTVPSIPTPALLPAATTQPSPARQLNLSIGVKTGFEEDELALAAALSSSDQQDTDADEPSDLQTPLAKAGENPLRSEPPARTRPTPLPRSTASFRQTTLFGQDQSQGVPSPSQGTTHIHSWPLTTKLEPPTHHKLDLHALKTWVFPTNLGGTRDYQYNIVQRGLFHNVLVALPTGLGKTFIAATIMLNWFRWAVHAQIVFMAPTKPLVSQQVEACFGVVGIPRSQTTMLTGNVEPAVRAEEWQSKRVFFLTPQTLMHDLKTGICDPKKLVLLVVDEAHRATGNYAYVEVVRFLRRFNSSFRVLALTATPGSSVEAVQNVMDALDIARVEIRTEESLDIRQYVHARNVHVEVFDNSEELDMSLDLFSKALQPVLDQLVGLNVYYSRDPLTLTPFGLTRARQQWSGTEAARQAGFPLKAKANAIFIVLASLAHAMELLKYHGIGSFYRNLLEFKNGIADGSKTGKYPNQIAGNEHFKKLWNRLQGWVNNSEFIGHPKLLYLKNVVLNHFMDAGEGRQGPGGPPSSNTRIMIFVHFRDSAEEVTRVLQRYGPMIRPHVFVGQSGGKGSQGMDQKTQLQVIEKFKQGTYNTIVATSIGEEGLDIGEIDLIVCYDSSSSPIRMLQRMGRTGRKRAGNITLLLMRGKEETSYIKAKDNYEKMQQMIASGSRFTFHEDRSPRIIPKDIVPVVDKRQVEIPIENSQAHLPEPKRRSRTAKKPQKRFHMPDGVETGFVQASLVAGGRPKRNRPRSLDADVAPLPNQESVLLSSKEELELDQRYCNVGGSTPQYVHKPRLDAFPEFQRKPRPTSLVGHSRLTSRLVKCFDTMQGCLDHSAFAQTSHGFDKELGALSASQPEDDGKASTTSDMTQFGGSQDTVVRNAAMLEDERSSTARAGENQPRSNPIHGKKSPRCAEQLQMSASREEQPFYVSQKSNASGHSTDDELPDVGKLVSGEEDRSSIVPSFIEGSPTQRSKHHRHNRRRVVDDSDEE